LPEWHTGRVCWLLERVPSHNDVYAYTFHQCSSISLRCSLTVRHSGTVHLRRNFGSIGDRRNTLLLVCVTPAYILVGVFMVIYIFFTLHQPLPLTVASLCSIPAFSSTAGMCSRCRQFLRLPEGGTPRVYCVGIHSSTFDYGSLVILHLFLATYTSSSASVRDSGNVKYCRNRLHIPALFEIAGMTYYSRVLRRFAFCYVQLCFLIHTSPIFS